MHEGLIRFLLEIYTLEEILERLDITPERVLEILIEEGHVDIRVVYNYGQEVIEEEATASSPSEYVGEGVTY